MLQCKPNNHHNSNHAAVQIAAKMIKSLAEILTECGFWFQNKHDDRMYNISTNILHPPIIYQDILSVELTGQKRYVNFSTERLAANSSVSISSLTAEAMHIHGGDGKSSACLM